MWAAAGKAIGVVLHKPFDDHILPPCAPDVEHGAIVPNVCPAGFWSGFHPIPSFCVPFLPFRMEMFILCHHILDICTLLLIYTVAHSEEFAFSLRKYWYPILSLASLSLSLSLHLSAFVTAMVPSLFYYYVLLRHSPRTQSKWS